jgi:Ca-activated chloride channel family protein
MNANASFGKATLGLFWAASVLAQTADVPSPNIRVQSSLVLVPVTVTDPANRYVLGLEKQNFRIFEDDREQKIAQFSGEDAALSVGLIFDTSGSMGSKLATARMALVEFLKTMNAPDETFLVEFSDRAELTLGFTDDTSQIEQKLTAVRSGGLTALFDAVHLALREMKKARNPRKALLIVSDGGDNSSVYTSKEIEELVREADVQIYTLGVFEPYAFLGMSKEEMSGPRTLSAISEQTGGRAYAASSSAELPDIAVRIGIELRNQYLLAYSPANATKSGSFRKVRVKVMQPEGLPGLKARWRLGYYAPG